MSVPRVLIVRVGAMGDVLHALPAVAALRQRWPDAQLDWVVDTRWTPLLINESGGGPLVSGVYRAETKLWSRAPFSAATVRSVLGMQRSLRAPGYDHVVDMQGTLRSAVLGRFAAGPAVAGYADPRERAAAALYGRRLPRRGTHVVEQGAALLGDALGLELAPIAPMLPCEASAEAWADDLVRGSGSGKRLALLAPAAGWGAKQWPTAHFGALARQLARMGWAVFVNASATNDLISAGIAGQTASVRAVPSSLSQLIALLRRADLVLGGDSGPIHLAAALGRPVVGLYGPTDPARNGPWGPGPKSVLRDPSSVTSYRHVATPDPGLARISVAQVLAAVQAITAE